MWIRIQLSTSKRIRIRIKLLFNVMGICVSVHGSIWALKLLNFDFKADPDPAFKCNADSNPCERPRLLKRIRIHLQKTMRTWIRIRNPGTKNVFSFPQHQKRRAQRRPARILTMRCTGASSRSRQPCSRTASWRYPRTTRSPTARSPRSVRAMFTVFLIRIWSGLDPVSNG